MRTTAFLAIAVATFVAQIVAGDFESNGKIHTRLRGGSDESDRPSVQTAHSYAPQHGYSFEDLSQYGDRRTKPRAGKVALSTTTPPTQSTTVKSDAVAGSPLGMSQVAARPAVQVAASQTTYSDDTDPHQTAVETPAPTPTKTITTLGDSSVVGRPISKSATPSPSSPPPASSDDANPQQFDAETSEPTSGTPLNDGDVSGDPVAQTPSTDSGDTDPQQSTVETPEPTAKKGTSLGDSDVAGRPVAKTPSPSPTPSDGATEAPTPDDISSAKQSYL